jgi:hypothetical protein
MRTTYIVGALMVGVAALAQTQPLLPSHRDLHRYAKELDRLEKLCLATNCYSDDRFWRESKRVADRTGPQIIHAVLLRGRAWREEEGLVFAPLVVMLPQKSAIRLLREYERSPRRSDQIWAHEFLIEIAAPDTKEMLRRYSKNSR